MRKQPRQARSQQRVQVILNAAEAEFAEQGFDNATTNAIAARAAVPIGSLYQYFPNKEALLTGVVERYTTEMQALYSDLLTPDSAQTITNIVARLVAGIARFEAEHAGFYTIFASGSLAETTSGAHTLHTDIIARVDALLNEHFPAFDPERRTLTATVCVAITKGLMGLAKPPDQLPVDAVLTETQAALLAYLRAALIREGIDLPPDLQP